MRILLLVTGFLWAWSGFLGVDSSESASTASNYSLAEKSLKITKEGFNKENLLYNYQLNISYPVVRIDEPDIDYELNMAIQEIMSGAISDFQSKIYTEKANEKEGYSYLTLDYDVCRQLETVVSVRFIKITHYVGIEHPSLLYLTLNYDLEKKDFIFLKDIFKEGIDYKTILMDKINSNPDYCHIKKAKFLGNFCIEDECLVLTLNNSNGDRENCPESFRIKWSDLSDILNENAIGAHLNSHTK